MRKNDMYYDNETAMFADLARRVDLRRQAAGARECEAAATRQAEKDAHGARLERNGKLLLCGMAAAVSAMVAMLAWQLGARGAAIPPACICALAVWRGLAV